MRKNAPQAIAARSDAISSHLASYGSSGSCNLLAPRFFISANDPSTPETTGTLLYAKWRNRHLWGPDRHLGRQSRHSYLVYLPRQIVLPGCRYGRAAPVPNQEPSGRLRQFFRWMPLAQMARYLYDRRYCTQENE